ncbi:unnamed protein product [Diamesa serratosioi]
MDKLLIKTTIGTLLDDVEITTQFHNESLLEIYSDDDIEADERLRTLVSIVVPIFFGIIAITGLIGNILVVYVVLNNHQMRSTTNTLLVNLASADLLFIVFCVPFTAVDYMLSEWPFGLLWCKVVQYLIIVTAYASIYTLVLISFERYLAVCFPICSISMRNQRNTSIAIAALWIVILVLSLPVLYAHGLHVITNNYTEENHTFSSCTFITTNDLISFSFYHISFFTTSYMVPLFLISIMYFLMLLRLWRSNLVSTSSESQRGKKKVTRLCVVIVTTFMILWMPIQVILLLKSLEMFKPTTHFKIALQICAHVMAYCSSCINPVLYAFLSENFRKSFRKIAYCIYNNNSRGENQHMIFKDRATTGGSTQRTGSF